MLRILCRVSALVVVLLAPAAAVEAKGPFVDPDGVAWQLPASPAKAPLVDPNG